MPALHSTDASKLLCLIACLLWLPLHAHAFEIYKWVDERGQTHYSDHPVENSAMQQIDIIPAPPSASSDAAARLERQQRLLRSMQESHAEKQRLRREKQAQLESEKRQRDKCSKMHEELAGYDKGGRLWYEVDAAGNRNQLTPEQLEQRKTVLRHNINQYCGNKSRQPLLLRQNMLIHMDKHSTHQ